jgi:sulfatase maturation enzyme AslB (radical SAM superfamily)
MLASPKAFFWQKQNYEAIIREIMQIMVINRNATGHLMNFQRFMVLLYARPDTCGAFAFHPFKNTYIISANCDIYVAKIGAPGLVGYGQMAARNYF